MSNKNEIYDMLEEEHLDFMIRLACKQQEAEEVDRILDEISDQPTEEEVRVCEEAYALFEKKLAEQQKAEQRIQRRQNLHRTVPKLIQAAACVVIAVGIAAPIAVAASPTVRAKVMQLLITLERDHTKVGLTGDENAGFDIPAEWQGMYFPSYMPEGYSIVDVSSNQCSVVYQNEAGVQICFREKHQQSGSNINDVNANISYAAVHDQQALVLERNSLVSLVWNNGTKYFVLEADLPRQELIRIAESVCPIK